MGEKIEIEVSGDVDEASLSAADRDLDRFADRITEKFSKIGEQSGEKFTRGLDGKLRDARGRFVKDGLGGLGDEAAGAGARAAGRFADSFADMLAKALRSSLGGVFGFAETTAATGGLNLLVMALLALVAAAALALAGLILLVPVMGVIAGAAGAAATAFVGLVGTVGVLWMGLGGLGDAWQAYGQKAAGGGQSATAAARAAAQAQREVKNATDALADAQKEALAAQQGLVRAREDESERLEDLSRSLKGAKLDEASAVLAVKQAEDRLRAARQGGSSTDVQEALIGVDRAKLQLEEVQDRVGDLSREQDKANADGIEGSDRVQAAYDRQRQAQKRLEDATYRLADAQARLKDGAAGAGGGVDKFAEAMDKLSPNAQKLMRVLFGLQDRFDGLKKRVQDRLLAGFDTEVKDLAEKWLPALDPMLGRLADRFNSVGKHLFEALGRPQFIKDVSATMDGFGRVTERVLNSIPVDALGRVARASLPFFEKLGDLIGGMFDNFSKWIEKLDKSGKLDEFFGDAAKSLEDIWTIGGLALDIVGEIFEILWPSSKKESDSFLGGVKNQLQSVRDWLADPENQKRVQDFIDKVQDLVHKVGTEWIPKAGEWILKIDGWVTKIGGWGDAIGAIPKKIKAAWDKSTGIFDGLKNSFKSALNWIIDRWNSLHFTVSAPDWLGGDKTVGTSPIQRFAHGGIAGGLIMAGEHGRELIRVPHGSTVIPNGTTESMLANGGGGGILPAVRVVIDLLGADEELKRRIKKMVRIDGGGSVEVAFT